MKKAVLLLVAVMIASTLFAGAVLAADQPIRIGYICKLLTNPWFIQEEYGIQKKANELGMEVISIDATLDNEKFLSAVDNLINRSIDGLLLVTPDVGMGPVVARRAEKAGIPIITIDDPMKDAQGNPIPHVGMPSYDLGVRGGKILAETAAERDFFASGNIVKFMALDTLTLPPVHERIVGFVDGFKEARPDFSDQDIIRPNCEDYFYEKDLNAAMATINAHPEATHWIISGGNDDAAVAGLQALEKRGFDMSHVLSLGLGGYTISLEQWKKGGDIGKAYMAIKTKPDGEGEVAAQMLYDNIVNGKEIPETTFIGGDLVTFENYLDYYPDGQMQDYSKPYPWE